MRRGTRVRVLATGSTGSVTGSTTSGLVTVLLDDADDAPRAFDVVEVALVDECPRCSGEHRVTACPEVTR